MEQIAEIVRADNPDIELDTRTDPNMDHVLHELLSRIDGVIKVKAETETVIEETEEAREAVKQLNIIDQELKIIDTTIDQIRRDGKSGRDVSNEEEESETTEDKTLEEIDAKLQKLVEKRIKLSNELRAMRDSADVGMSQNNESWVNLKNQIDELNTEIRGLEAQRDALIADK